ncbi:MAG: type II toxin-antitoxin system CcdA family antitoxin [Rhodocyclaceae bacterium]|nr:type II toxin-antitoxin system CcdA family antitoxin [Rhodocyclaceae bacterium]MDP1956587.1 type II toxin-antitoxin system CcdA family antitoxin [Rhodocyclaceae bacterium]
MLNVLDSPSKKGRLSLSIDQNLLDRLEPYKQQINLSAQAEKFLSGMLEEIENRAWAERNAAALAAHGRDIATTGLAGEEFERV